MKVESSSLERRMTWVLRKLIRDKVREKYMSEDNADELTKWCQLMVSPERRSGHLVVIGRCRTCSVAAERTWSSSWYEFVRCRTSTAPCRRRTGVSPPPAAIGCASCPGNRRSLTEAAWRVSPATSDCSRWGQGRGRIRVLWVLYTHTNKFI